MLETQWSSPRLCAPGASGAADRSWGPPPSQSHQDTHGHSTALAAPGPGCEQRPSQEISIPNMEDLQVGYWSNHHLPMKKIKPGRLRDSCRCAQLAGGRAAHSCRKLPTPKSSPHSGHTRSRHEVEPDTLTLQPREGEAHTGAPQSRLEGEDSGRELCRSRV